VTDSRVRTGGAAFVMGMVAAAVAELSGALLLYADDGFVRALTLVLGVALASIGAGLTTAPRPGSALRMHRRWLLAIAAFALAAAASGAWSLAATFTGTPLSRGVGLALLAALPLYATGAVLGGLAAARTGARVGAAALLGAAAGAVVLGSVLLVRLEPISIYLLCVVLTSGAALVQGSSRNATEELEEPGNDAT
jgi:hypothetical protein